MTAKTVRIIPISNQELGENAVNQIVMRKIALSVSSISIGGFLTVLLLCSACKVNCFADSSYVPAVAETVFSIPSTPLVVETLAVYDGGFYEDSSGTEVMGIASVMLKNTSHTLIPYASVVIYTEHCRYEFEATMIPPESTVLIPEMNRVLLTEDQIASCFGWTTVYQTDLPEYLTVTADDNVRITNHSGQTIRELTVYHRTYLPEGEFYMGGKAFETQIPHIPAGESVTFLPENYAPGYSQIVWYSHSE